MHLITQHKITLKLRIIFAALFTKISEADILLKFREALNI